MDVTILDVYKQNKTKNSRIWPSVPKNNGAYMILW